MKNEQSNTNEKGMAYDRLLPAVPYQLCPKCGGQGTVSKPPYVAGDVHEWSSTSCSFTCDVCDGKKIIPMYIISEVPVDE
jgi:hypothetical protein